MSDGSGSKVYFSPYDIFGYLLPGIIVWAPLKQFHGWIQSMIENRFQQDSRSYNVLLIMMRSVTGHLIAAISGMILERRIIWATKLGSENLLRSSLPRSPALPRLLGIGGVCCDGTRRRLRDLKW